MSTSNGQCILDIHTHRIDPLQPAVYSLTPGYEFHPEVSGPASEATPLYYSLGIHPWKVVAFHEGVYCTPAQLEEWLMHPRVRAVGEAGLDALRTPAPPASLAQEKAWQQAVECFEWQAALAEKVGKPLIIHCVKAQDTLFALHRNLHPVQPWIIHGFRGKERQAAQFLDHGFYLSLGEYFNPYAARIIPSDRLFLETDESPIPLSVTLSRVAAARDESAASLAEAIQNTVKRFFI